jgi:sugar lactone lactonase YvrE
MEITLPLLQTLTHAFKRARIKLFVACAILCSHLSTAQIVTTIAGNGSPTYTGDGGSALMCTLNAPASVTFDGSGNLFVCDYFNSVVRKINTSGIITTVAGNGTYGYSGDHGAATLAQLNGPTDVAIDASGNLYIADYNNNVIRMVNAAGIITTIAGDGSTAYGGDGGPATAAQMYMPNTVVIDVAGNLYIADEVNNRIRKVNTAGIISTIAGVGTAGYSGDGGPAIAAQLNAPSGVTFDASGNLLICDLWNNRIRKIDGSGIISTIAGAGIGGYGGDGGPATAALILNPGHVYYHASSGDLYFADDANSCIRRIDASGIINTVAGIADSFGFNLDGRPPTASWLNAPKGVTLDASGNLYIADHYNNRVRKIVTGFHPITGADTVCPSATVTLSDATAGGTWSSSNTAIATVNSAGAVTGVAVGTAIISYTVSSISATFPVSVALSSDCSALTLAVSRVGINIFPNPAATQLTIEGASGGDLTIFNLVGKELCHTIITSDKQSLNISTLPSGVYMAQMINSTGEKKNIRLVKE